MLGLVRCSLCLGMLSLFAVGQHKDAFLIAARQGNDVSVEELIKVGALTGLTGWLERGLIHEAAFSGNTHVIKQLLAAGVPVDQVDVFGWSALLMAAADNQLEVATTLLDAGANINLADHQGKTALTWAAARGHEKMVNLLLANQANPTATDNQGLFAGDHLPISAAPMKQLPMGEQTRKGHFVRVIDTREEVRPTGQELRPMVDGRFYTDLLANVWNGNTEAVIALAEAKADLNLRGPYDETALHLAVERANPEMLAILLKGGANPDLADKSGWTPLILAANSDLLALAELLINNGANVDAAQEQGINSLMFAAMNNHVLVAKLLLRSKANRTATDATGRTALDHANPVRSKDLFQLMRQLGLRPGPKKSQAALPDSAGSRLSNMNMAARKASAQPKPVGEGFYVADESQAEVLNQGFGNLLLGNYEKVLESCKKAREQTPTPSPALVYLETALALAQEDTATAEVSFALAQKLVPNQKLLARLALGIGRIYFGRNPANTAADPFLFAAWQMGGEADALYYLARLEKARGRLGFAIPLLERHLQLPVSVDGHDPTRQDLLNAWTMRQGLTKGGRVGELGLSRVGQEDDLLDLEAFRGKVVLLDFWSYWATTEDKFADPYPILKRLYKWFPNRPYVAISVTGNNEATQIQDFIKDHEITWPVYQDTNLKVCGPLFGIKGYPSLLLLDHEGKILQVYDGFTVHYEGNLRTQIKEAIELAEAQ